MLLGGSASQGVGVLAHILPDLLGDASGGAVILSGKVRAALDDYWRRYRGGEMPVFDESTESDSISIRIEPAVS